jgi:pimeloyl-ACP methyl ester carboxylesterase
MGRVFVCLHGIGGRPLDWSGVTDCLCGLGEVDCPSVPGGSLATARDTVIAQLADERRATVLVGHSRGGVLALMVAAQRPELVERVVLSGGYVPPSRADRSWVVGAGSWVKHRTRLAGSFVRSGHLSQSRASRGGPLSTSLAAVLEIASVGLRPHAFDALAQEVRCPVLMICGARDSHVPASWASAAARRYGWSLEVLPDGTHFSHVETPAAWADTVTRWLAP